MGVGEGLVVAVEGRRVRVGSVGGVWGSISAGIGEWGAVGGDGSGGGEGDQAGENELKWEESHCLES